MKRLFFAFAVLGLWVGWLSVQLFWLPIQSPPALPGDTARYNGGCKPYQPEKYLAHSIAPTTIICVQEAVEHRLEMPAVNTTNTIVILSSTVVTALSTRIWRMQNQWYELVQALCKPTPLKEVLNPVAQLRQVQRKYQAGAYHWRPSQALQRRTAFSH